MLVAPRSFARLQRAFRRKHQRGFVMWPWISRTKSGGYTIDHSVRFRSAATSYISRTFGTPTDNKKWTYSVWVKKGTLNAFQSIFSADDGTTNNFLNFRIDNSSGALDCYQFTGGAYNLQMTTSAVRRDPSAHYHVVLVYDSANATSTDRVQIWVNGVRETVTYAVGPFAQNTACQANVASRSHAIGRLGGANANYFDGLAAEPIFVDGQALTPSSFGQFDTNNVWTPKAYSGNYGNNGSYLKFNDGSSLANLCLDRSGNGNNWTAANVSLTAGPAYDWMVDTPTNNYAVLNPLNPIASGVTYSEGNLKLAIGSPAGGKTAKSTMPFPSSGLTYLEFLSDNGSDASTGIGFGFMVGSAWYYLYASSAAAFYANGSTQATGMALISGGVTYQLALDAATGKAWIGRNNVWYNSTGGTTGDPSTGANPTFTLPAGECFPFIYGDVTTTITFKANFGQRPFAYTPPTGFKALCTANMPAVAVPNGRKHVDVLLHSGNGGTQNITGAQFQPDLVWVKSRANANGHVLQDAVRGFGSATKLASNATTQENGTGGVDTDPQWGYVTGALSNGFSATIGSGTGDQMNRSGYTYVDWLWKAGGAPVTNNAGSITSQVSANPAAGISIVTFATPASGAFTVGHGLGVTPALIIEKQRGSTGGWPVWFQGYGTTDYLYLNQTSAKGSAAAAWGSAVPNSSTFGMTAGVLTGTSLTQVAYCFAEVPGFSKFGSYIGNGSTDGPFVYCGFRPRWVMVKCSSSGADWLIFDTARNTYNVMNAAIYPDLSNAEETTAVIADSLSNGFKVRNSFTNINTSGQTYIFVAFAENPFGGSNVSPACAR